MSIPGEIYLNLDQVFFFFFCKNINTIEIKKKLLSKRQFFIDSIKNKLITKSPLMCNFQKI